MPKFTTKRFTLSFPGWIILWLQAPVAWYYIHEWDGLLGRVKQGKIRWSGRTWTTFFLKSSKSHRKECSIRVSNREAKQHGHRLHIRKVPKSTDKTNSQFGPIRIYTFTESIFDRLPSLHRDRQTEKETPKTPPQSNYCHPALCYWVQYYHICSGLKESSVPLFPLQEQTGCTCSLFSKPRVGAKTGTT